MHERRQREIGGRSGGALLICGRHTYGTRVGDEVARCNTKRNPLAAVGASPPGSANRRSSRGPFSRSARSLFRRSATSARCREKFFGCHLDFSLLSLFSLPYEFTRRCNAPPYKMIERRANLFLRSIFANARTLFIRFVIYFFSCREERLHFIVDREIDCPTLFSSNQVQGYITDISVANLYKLASRSIKCTLYGSLCGFDGNVVFPEPYNLEFSRYYFWRDSNSEKPVSMLSIRYVTFVNVRWTEYTRFPRK